MQETFKKRHTKKKEKFMNNRSDFADEWFNESHKQIFDEKIEHLKNNLILKWIKVNEMQNKEKLFVINLKKLLNILWIYKTK